MIISKGLEELESRKHRWSTSRQNQGKTLPSALRNKTAGFFEGLGREATGHLLICPWRARDGRVAQRKQDRGDGGGDPRQCFLGLALERPCSHHLDLLILFPPPPHASPILRYFSLFHIIEDRNFYTVSLHWGKGRKSCLLPAPPPPPALSPHSLN